MKVGNHRRRARRGFTLLELMAVVALIGIIGAIAAPSFATARDDAVAFDYGRRYQQLLATARARAAGTGSAHLALLGPGTMGRGFIRLYAALDGATPGSVAPFNPVSSCKTNPIQWNDALVIAPPKLDGNGARFIDHVDANLTKNVDMDLRAELLIGEGAAGSPSVSTSWLAVCVTPAGVTYVGASGTPEGAVDNMRTSVPFTGVAEVHIQRHKGGAPLGLRRLVVMSGGGSPRLRSD